MNTEIRCRIELRAASDSPGRIVGTVIEQGRVAGDRPEVFAPGALAWPSEGIRLLAEHQGRQVMRVTPTVDGTAIKIDAPLPDTAIGREVASEVRAGTKRGLSIEFHSMAESVVQGVREIRSAFMDAAAVVTEGAYDQAVVEVRQRQRRRVWL